MVVWQLILLSASHLHQGNIALLFDVLLSVQKEEKEDEEIEAERKERKIQ